MKCKQENSLICHTQRFISQTWNYMELYDSKCSGRNALPPSCLIMPLKLISCQRSVGRLSQWKVPLVLHLKLNFHPSFGIEIHQFNIFQNFLRSVLYCIRSTCNYIINQYVWNTHMLLNWHQILCKYLTTVSVLRLTIVSLPYQQRKKKLRRFWAVNNCDKVDFLYGDAQKTETGYICLSIISHARWRGIKRS